MKKLIKIICFILITISCYSQKKTNILFIAIDDLRPELGCYGSNIAITPNIDKLASEGLLFNNAYCQQAICGPSRASLLTGIRPETSGVYHNYIKFRDVNPDVVTLPQQFKNNGYETVYCGKIFHHGDLDDELSWSRQPAIDSMLVKNIKRPGGFALEENNKNRKEQRTKMIAKYGEVAKYGLAMGPAYENADVEDNEYLDGYNTELAIATMKEMSAKSNTPFFLGLGFNKPHLNWTSPKKYWDLYSPDKIKLALEKQGPKQGAEMGLHASFELRTRSGIPKKEEISREQALKLKHAYLACVSYVDAQIGKIITELEKEGLRENTIIILWSDHGYHLGDMGIWGKATNYEIATRVPLIIWTPDMPSKNKDKKTDALVELVDIYPTLCDYANIPVPNYVEGYSFKPLINNPAQKWKSAAFSQFPTPALREWGAYPLRPAMKETFFGPLIKDVEDRIINQQKENWDRDLFENKLMGYAMRTKKHRFIVWKDRDNPQKQPLFIELYDHDNDPLETTNIANVKPKLVKKLMTKFNKGWQGNRPKK
ncbi:MULTISPECIES: sulfatase [unclassified Cellulophaga]|uniref:sulfatase n=1 Tax=unclassified Cellulophaga TaxID=2634405 RepID=UPI0026E2E81D|nr:MULTISPECIES: sulfatase [unclassified Cellulophaga]MDO6490201.1 sulfatase [Cellulophaga sp. 2_MG-2023]MDO6494605.1 sulfatase [Cellulophaga sp. 3_MG-2023]